MSGRHIVLTVAEMGTKPALIAAGRIAELATEDLVRAAPTAEVVRALAAFAEPCRRLPAFRQTMAQ